jgi:hypothetical protein
MMDSGSACFFSTKKAVFRTTGLMAGQSFIIIPLGPNINDLISG